MVYALEADNRRRERGWRQKSYAGTNEPGERLIACLSQISSSDIIDKDQFIKQTLGSRNLDSTVHSISTLCHQSVFSAVLANAATQRQYLQHNFESHSIQSSWRLALSAIVASFSSILLASPCISLLSCPFDFLDPPLRLNWRDVSRAIYD
jgi:hypothetical protein